MKTTETETHDSDLRALATTVLDSIEEARALTQAMQQTAATLARRLDEPVVPGLQGALDELLAVMRAEHAPPARAWSWLVGGCVGVALLSGALGWYVGRIPREVQQRAGLMLHLNAVLVERQSTLPADLRTKLGTVYQQFGFPTLEQQGRK